MAIRLGDEAPNFQAKTTQGDLDFHEYIGSGWAILFSHPKDFTPVCTTELGYMSKIQGEFEKRQVKLVALSVDSLEEHAAWLADINESQNTRVSYPIIADGSREIATLYDMIHPNASNSLTVRSVFVVGPDKKVKLTLTYPASTGRNFDEVLRVVDSLQLTAKSGVATPVNWKKGERCIVLPSISTEDAKVKFSDVEVSELPSGKAYLRYTSDPSLQTVS
ncbi:MAG: alkyl hydroperoxide reductase subunit AhpC [Candidatus Marinamargulisbacteria bacterium]|jgi:alkyl hydroperoxide reductase subunit AhpC